MRISRHMMYMEMAQVVAKRATCFRGANGSVIVSGEKISIGYNGPPSGEEHCLGSKCPLTPLGFCQRSKHAEANAILRADEDFWETDELVSMYSTSAPCYNCAVDICGHGVDMFFFQNFYHSSDGLDLLLHRISLSVYRITAGGYIVDQEINQVVEYGYGAP